MRSLIALFEFFIFTTMACASPEGSWPEEASYISLSKKNWVLVIPARRSENGEIVLWNKEDEWLQQWIVPRQTNSGMKTVAITGDADDRRLVQGYHLENMDVNVLNKLAAKYRAAAIAIAIKDKSEQLAVAGWVSGEGAAWRSINSHEANREAALGMIDDIFNGYSDPSEGTVQEDTIAITGQRQNAGWTEYRLEYFSPESILKLQSIPGVEIVGNSDTNRPSVIVRITDGRDIETVLRSAGISYQ
jgi:hypothetical protein